eukprot:COSAG05_NODE_5807_length_1083_cov_2.142276_2_plen_149_part_01
MGNLCSDGVAHRATLTTLAIKTVRKLVTMAQYHALSASCLHRPHLLCPHQAPAFVVCNNSSPGARCSQLAARTPDLGPNGSPSQLPVGVVGTTGSGEDLLSVAPRQHPGDKDCEETGHYGTYSAPTTMLLNVDNFGDKDCEETGHYRA